MKHFANHAQQRVVFETAHTEDDAYGGRHTLWQPHVTCWAVVRLGVSSMRQEGNYARVRKPIEMVTRYDAALVGLPLDGVRLQHQGQLYQVRGYRAVLEDGKTEGTAFLYWQLEQGALEEGNTAVTTP